MSCCHSSFELLLLLGTWPSACYQRVDVLSQLLDIHSAFELLLGTCVKKGKRGARRQKAATVLPNRTAAA